MSVAELEPPASGGTPHPDGPAGADRNAAGPRRRRPGWSRRPPPELLVFAVALAARLTVMLRDGGLRGSNGYDAGVYFAAGDALIHGRLPYRDFVFLHPPGLPVALTPFAWLTKVMSDESAFTVANLAFAVLGAVSAVLVVQVARRLGFAPAAALVSGLFYALWFGAIGSEYLVKLEDLGNVVFLCALLATLRAQERNGRWASVAAGFGYGYLVSIKIWWIVPVLAVLVWHGLRMRRGRALAPVLAGVAAAGLVVDLPFFVLAPHQMFSSVISDQVGRDRAASTVAARIADLTSVSRLYGHLPLAVVAGAGVAMGVLFCVTFVRAWRGRLGRPLVVLAAVQLATLLLAPSWFLYYCDYVAVPLALVVGGAAVLRDERRRAAGRVAGWLPVAAVAVVTAVTLAVGAAAVTPFRGAGPLTRAVAGARCVMSDSPLAQIELDALSRGLAAHCRNWVDVSGKTYGPDRGTFPGEPRVDNLRWQRDVLGYLRSGDAVILVRQGVVSRRSRAVLARDGLLARVDGHAVYRVAH